MSVTDTDRRRFDAVVSEVVEPVRRFLARRTDLATVDDVAAEVLEVCWRRLDDVPGDAPVPWAIGVARNCLRNAERSVRRRERLVHRIVTVDPPAEGVDGPVHDDHSGLHRALGRLPVKDAEVLRLWAWEQLVPAEIATVLDISANAANLRLHRAKAKLRRHLAESA